jgi:hypothetical protein
MRPATKTHIVFAGRTNYVVATRFFLNWNTTMATWFGKLLNRLFRLADLSSGFVFITATTWVCVAMHRAKGMVTKGASQLILGSTKSLILFLGHGFETL